MYKVGDEVIYNGFVYNIKGAGDDGWYILKDSFAGEAIKLVHAKDLNPLIAPGDYVTLVNKGCKIGPDGFNIDSMVIDNVISHGRVTIKGVKGSYNAELFKRIPKPRHTIRYTVYDNVSGTDLETFSNEKDAIEKCETLNKVSINIGDIFKHSDGTAVEVVNSTLEETEVMLETAGSVYYSKYNTQQFLKEFTK
ncbi:hypothetical protein [Flyfo podovirus Tbat2_2]|nr:hypothetical protein [Flyfo podovirus Tbat2_2]